MLKPMSTLDDVAPRPEGADGEPVSTIRPARRRRAAAPAAAAAPSVRLVVYGWTGVEPGTLSWDFPNVVSALCAVDAMRNAVRWVIISGGKAVGGDPRGLDELRKSGAVLIEQPG